MGKIIGIDLGTTNCCRRRNGRRHADCYLPLQKADVYARPWWHSIKMANAWSVKPRSDRQ